MLKNWRNFRTFDVPFSDRVIIIGPNASGKSNLLDAIRFLRDIAHPGGGLQRSITQRGGLSKVRCLAARREPDVEIEVELSEGGSAPEYKYAIGITQQVRGYRQPVLRSEKVWKNGSLLLRDAPLLLEEPELSLHSEIVKRLPALFARLQRQTKRQLFISTHNWDLLSEKSIGGEEVVMLTPGQEGTNAQLASSSTEVRTLLEAGLSIADAALPSSIPPQLSQLDLFQ